MTQSHPPNRIVTIERHILDTQKRVPGATGVFTQLMYDIAFAAKMIARETTRAGLVDITGEAGSHNVHGERQKKLDIYADRVIFQVNDHTGRLCVMASEEHDDILTIPERFPTGKYVLIYDPLDGSDNIDVNTSIGTIFAIYRKITGGRQGTLQDILQPGRALVAAGYVVYGSSTVLVYTTGHGVHGFTLDPSVGEFLLSHPNIRVPDKPKYYSVNQGYQKDWTTGVRQYARWLQGLDAQDNGSPSLSQRYVGALVADFHRNLLKGGVYLYPGTMRNPEKPAGKLRLLYECAPLAYIMEQAGGAASDGSTDILDIQPHSLHQRVPFFAGNTFLVEKAIDLIQEHDTDWLERYYTYRDQPPQF